MNTQALFNSLRVVVATVAELDNPAGNSADVYYLNFSLGLVTGTLSKSFIDVERRAVLEDEMQEAAKSLPSDTAKAILALAVQSVAHVLFSGNRIKEDGTKVIAEIDDGRDVPMDTLKALALTLDPETLLPKVSVTE